MCQINFLKKKKKIFNHTYISNTAAQSGRNIRCVSPAPCIPIKISEFLVISNCFLNDTFLLYTTYIKKKDFHYTSIHFRHSYHSFNQYLFHFVQRIFFQSPHQFILVQNSSILSISAKQSNSYSLVLPFMERYTQSVQHMFAESFEQSTVLTAVNLKIIFIDRKN